MRTRTLGAGGPEVSVVGLGCNNFGPRCDAERTRVVIDAALDAGITLLDTADVYGDGLSEEYIGAALAGRREGIVVATKFGKPMPDAPDLPRGSRDYVRWAVEGSLRRLGIDAIDVYQLHEPDPATPIDETLTALHELVEEGLVRHLGSSNFSAAQIEEADRVARERGLTRFVSAQNRYSLVRREAEDELLPACEGLGLGFLPYFPLESGLLTGKYARGVTPTEGRLAQRPEWLTDEAFDRVDALADLASEHGASLLEVAVGGLLAMPAVASVIAGATTPEQVRANAEAGAWEPDADAAAALASLR